MDIQQLANAAAARINKGNTVLQLVLPAKRTDNKYRYLAGKKSPKGLILGMAAKGSGVIVNFDPLDVLAFCVVHGAEVTAVMGSDGRVLNTSDLLAEVQQEAK